MDTGPCSLIALQGQQDTQDADRNFDPLPESMPFLIASTAKVGKVTLMRSNVGFLLDQNTTF